VFSELPAVSALNGLNPDPESPKLGAALPSPDPKENPLVAVLLAGNTLRKKQVSFIHKEKKEKNKKTSSCCSN
jgi:hypothetical protein